MDPRFKNAIPSNILGTLTTSFISTFAQYLDAQIVTSVTNVNYLKLAVTREIDEEYFYLVELSNERLQQINGGGMYMIYTFQKPERGIVYFAQFDSENNIHKLWKVDPEVTKIKWPIPDTFKIDLKPFENPTHDDDIQFSKETVRFRTDNPFEPDGLKDNKKALSVKNFVIPNSIRIKTQILEYNQSRLPKNSERVKVKHVTVLNSIIALRTYSPTITTKVCTIQIMNWKI